jgi:hypothetical protein
VKYGPILRGGRPARGGSGPGSPPCAAPLRPRAGRGGPSGSGKLECLTASAGPSGVTGGVDTQAEVAGADDNVLLVADRCSGRGFQVPAAGEGGERQREFAHAERVADAFAGAQAMPLRVSGSDCGVQGELPGHHSPGRAANLPGLPVGVLRGGALTESIGLD